MNDEYAGNWLTALYDIMNAQLAPYIVQVPPQEATFILKPGPTGGYTNTVIFYLNVAGRELKVEVSPVR